jgi:tetratricopeptide (TPR) repeat protein
VLCACSGDDAASQATGGGAVIAITNVHIIPMDRERVLRDHTVIVRADSIVAVTASGSADVPAGAQRIDGRGGYLMPGLTDAHVHLYYGNAGFPSYLAYGVTSVFNLNGSPEVLAARRRVAAGELIGPHIYTTGPTIDGTPPLNTLFVSVATADGARRVVAQQKSDGYDFIKVYSNLDAPTYRAVLEEAGRQQMAVVGHVPRAVGWRDVLAHTGLAPQANIAHIEEFFQLPIDDAEFAEVVRLARAAAQLDPPLMVTVNLFAYSDYLRAIAELPHLRGVLADPEMRFVGPAALSEKLPSNHRANRANPQQFADVLRRQQARFRVLTRMLHDADVPLLVGTDTEIFGFPGQSVHQELQELVASGLTAYQALRAATANAGTFVGQHVPDAGPFGTIAVGQRADLVLLDANPLDDIGNATRVRGVLVGGHWLPRAHIDALRDSVARTHEAAYPLVMRFDSLLSAGNVQAAVARMREMQRRFPTLLAVSESALRGYGRRLMEGDPRGALTIRGLATELYPRSFSAWGELARGELATGDTVAARTHLQRALALSPDDYWLGELLARTRF